MSTLKLRIQGHNAAAIGEVWRQQFGEVFEVFPEISTFPRGLRLRGVNLLDVAIVVLTIPPAILAAIKLVERLERRRKLRSLLQELRRRTAGGGARLTIQFGEEQYDFERASDADVDLIADAFGEDEGKDG